MPLHVAGRPSKWKISKELKPRWKSFDYDNILLLPRKCRVESRSECATPWRRQPQFSHPGRAANMKTVVDERICTWLAQNGYFYVMHRFDLDNVQFVKT